MSRNRFPPLLLYITLGLLGLFSALPALAQVIPYEFDPAFNGNYAIDAFTTGEKTGAQRYGGKLARLPDGDVVVAGIARLDNDPIAPNWNLGLVRYNPGGSRVAWSGSGLNFHAGNQYVVYPNLPNGGSGYTTIRKVSDIAYAGGRIYVLVRTLFNPSPQDHDVQLLIFAEDGSYVNSINVFNSSEDEDSVALSVLETGAVANPVAIAVLGRRSGIRSAIAKYLVNSSNVIQLDSSFGGGDGRVEFVLPTAECTYADCEFLATDIAFPLGGGGGSSRPIYLSGWARRDSPSASDTDMVAVKFTPAGLLDINFDFNGVRQYAFDDPGSSLADYAAALIATRSPLGNFDTVWLVGPVARTCSQGAGVIRLDGASGAPDSTFGSVGRALFGGSGQPAGPDCTARDYLDPADLVIQDNEIAIAASLFQLDQNGARMAERGGLLRLSASTGQRYSLDELGLFAGDKYFPSVLRGIGTGEGGGRYYVSGHGQTSLYNSLYLVGRVKPIAEAIFRDGFEL